MLAGVSGDRIGQWARRGYIRSSQSDGSPRVYSYQDVAEAILVHELEGKVELAAIRRAIDQLREAYGDWPLTAARDRLLVPHGNALAPKARAKALAVAEPERVFDAADPFETELLLDPGDLERVASELRRGGWAVRDLPDLQYIEVDPDRLSGRPTIRGRRVAAEDVALIAASPGGRKRLREDFDLQEAEIHDAERWWSTVRSYEPAA